MQELLLLYNSGEEASLRLRGSLTALAAGGAFGFWCDVKATDLGFIGELKDRLGQADVIVFCLGPAGPGRYQSENEIIATANVLAGHPLTKLIVALVGGRAERPAELSVLQGYATQCSDLVLVADGASVLQDAERLLGQAFPGIAVRESVHEGQLARDIIESTIGERDNPQSLTMIFGPYALAEAGAPQLTPANLSRELLTGQRLSEIFSMRGSNGFGNGVSFDVPQGTTLGLVGESGSGKSTIGRVLVGLTPATAGTVTLLGRAITGPDGARNLRAVRRQLQFVFQDPYASLNPRMRVGDSIAEPLDVVGKMARQERLARIHALLGTVGLPVSAASRFPHEFSGGQRQRIGIARALALDPRLIVCDEPVSALDVSMQAQVVNLLMDLQDQRGLSYLFIAHDLAVVRMIATHVAVLYSGAIVELAEKRALYARPAHPYTQALLSAVPRLEPDRTRRTAVAGEVPSLLNPPPGCAFHTRCPHAFDRCRVEPPGMREIAPGHGTACHLHGDM